MIKDLNFELSDTFKRWILNSVKSGSEIISVKQLPGSTSSTILEVSIVNNQKRKNFVLRYHYMEEWIIEEPDVPIHEAESLQYAIEHGLSSPHLVSYDEDGTKSGEKAVLMTKLNGNVMLKPADVSSWVNGMAKSLAMIHKHEAINFPWKYEPYNDISKINIPDWSSNRNEWTSVLNVLKQPFPDTKPCFIHRDYHPANILWEDGKVSGIVDWVNACEGPAGIDVGHCRVNLVMLFGVEVADLFLKAYQFHAKENFLYDIYWDILSLYDMLSGPPKVYPGWEAFGVTGLTDKMMEKRVEEYMLHLLKEV